jgi:hypothetical protein
MQEVYAIIIGDMLKEKAA